MLIGFLHHMNERRVTKEGLDCIRVFYICSLAKGLGIRSPNGSRAYALKDLFILAEVLYKERQCRRQEEEAGPAAVPAASWAVSTVSWAVSTVSWAVSAWSASA